MSPENARERLAAFIKGARKQLLIYDPQVSDDAMLKLITERMADGVDVRIIGKVEAKWKVPGEKYPGKRLHVRAIIRDGKRAFIGSQSLRRLELEKRREVGVIVTDESVVQQMRRSSSRTGRRPKPGRRRRRRRRRQRRKTKRRSRRRREPRSDLRFQAADLGLACVLRAPPEVHRRDAVHAADRAVRRA